MEVKIFALSGHHIGNTVLYSFAGLGIDWRDVPSWSRRLTETITASNDFGPDIYIQVGDLIDAGDGVTPGTTPALRQSFLNQYISAVTSASSGIACPRADLLGNHIAGSSNDPTYDPIWDGDSGTATIQDYFDTIDVQKSGETLTKENFFGPDANPYGYTVDVSGVRYVMVYLPFGGVVSAGILSWLEARLAETSLPCVICSHAHLWEDPNHILAGAWRASNYQDVYDIIDQYPLVQLVIGGHRHDHAWHYKRNGIHFLSFGGSVGIPAERLANTTNNYAKITIDTEAIPTPYGLKASLTVEGTGIFGRSASQLPEVFGVM